MAHDFANTLGARHMGSQRNVSLVVIHWFLDDLVHEAQDPAQIAAAAILWAGVFGLRCLRIPEMSLIQADGNFRPLSLATLYSSVVTVPTVLLLTYSHGALWSLVEILLGEALATLFTVRLARRSVAPA